MSKVYNLAEKDEKITFDFGTYSLDFYSSDKKSKEVSDKAEELKKESDNLGKTEEGNEWELRDKLKKMLDEFFSIMFDDEAPQKIYQSAGENTISYLQIFLEISNAVKIENEKRFNDKAFEKYLSE